MYVLLISSFLDISLVGWTLDEIVKQAILACKAQAMVGHPTYDKFKQMVSSKSITNCRVKVNDVNNAHAIFDPYTANRFRVYSGLTDLTAGV